MQIESMTFHPQGQRHLVAAIDPEPNGRERLQQILLNSGIAIKFVDSGTEGLELIKTEKPHLILLEEKLPDMPLTQLLQQIRNDSTTRLLPVMVASREPQVEERLRILQMDIDDFVDKPFYPEEVAARIEMLLQENDLLQESLRLFNRGFNGNLREMSLVDLLQILELGGKSGRIELTRGRQSGMVYVRHGQLIDAEASDLHGEKALFTLMGWLEGYFQVVLGPIDRPPVLHGRHGELLAHGLRYHIKCKELSTQLPSLSTVMQAERSGPTGDLSSAEREVLALFAQPRSLESVISELALSDWVVLERLKNLIDKKMLRVVRAGKNGENHTSREWIQRIHRSVNTTKNHYTRILSFFLRTPAAEQNTPDLDSAAGAGRAANKPLRIFLNRSELLLLRQKLAQPLTAFWL